MTKAVVPPAPETPPPGPPAGGPEAKFRLVALRPDHVPAVVDIHLRAFPGFFLTFLGRRFLKTFYRSFLSETTAISWVAEDPQSGRVLGAVFGTTSPASFYKRIAARRWAAFAWAAAGAVGRRPLVLGRLVRALSYRGDPPKEPGYALLSSIAVAPETQGRGVGLALLGRFAAEAEGRSCRAAYLTTDALGNDAVNSFYGRAGWRVESTFETPEGRKMNRLILDFPAPRHDQARF